MTVKLKILFALVFICLIGSIKAQVTISIPPVADNTLFIDAFGSLSNGSGPNFFVGKTNGGAIRRALMKFNVAGSVPPGATIVSVSLVLSMDQTIAGPATTSLYVITNNWGEGGSVGSGGGAPSQANDATWIHRFFPDTIWSNSGGDIVGSASAVSIVGNNGLYTWSSAQMRNDVQNWLDNPSSDFGWLMKGDETLTPSAKRFGSRENPVPSSVPSLSITYTSPCVQAGIPVLNLSADTICLGDSATIQTTGTLNSASDWYLYTGGCGSTLRGIHPNGIFSVIPTSTTTYFIRGEGGCVTPGLCQSITLVVQQPPTAPVAGSNSPVIAGNTLNLTAGTIPGATYQWSGPALFNSSVQNPSISNVNALNAGTYTVTAYLNGCPGPSGTTVVLVNPAPISISGRCITPLGDSIRAVSLYLRGTNIDSILGSTHGDFSFSGITNAGTDTIRPAKNNDQIKSNGVTTLDLVFVRRHILNNDTLSSPYRILAADVNSSNTVTTLDMFFIRRLILGSDTTFAGNRLWAFVPSDYVFSDPIQIWTPAPPPSIRTFSNITQSQSLQNFIGVKLGDVNDSWNSGIAKTRFTGKLEVRPGDVNAKEGDLFSVPVKVSGFEKIAGMQFTLKWHAEDIELIDVKSGDLDPFFGYERSSSGILTVSWDEENGGLKSLPNGSTAFELNFRAKHSSGVASEISINSEVTSAEAYDSNLDLLEIESNSGSVWISNSLTNDERGLFEAYPSPFKGEITFSFQSTIKGQSGITIFNLLGEKIKSFQVNSSQGRNEIKWDAKREGIPTGIYLVQLENENSQRWQRVVFSGE